MSQQQQTERRFWVNTVSRDHVEAGVAGGFTQADHGKATRLRSLRRGDGIVFYSPRTRFRAGDPLQCFTAAGVVTGEAPYQVEVDGDWRPWRLDVRFLESSPAPVRPLLESLGFVQDPRRWGLPFRRGLFAIPADDARRIGSAMGVAWPETVALE